jgi:hypothetical protein
MPPVPLMPCARRAMIATRMVTAPVSVCFEGLNFDGPYLDGL